MVFTVGEGDATMVVVGGGGVQCGVPMDDYRRMFAVSPMHVLDGQHECRRHSLREHERSEDAPQRRPSHSAAIMATLTGDVNTI